MITTPPTLPFAEFFSIQKPNIRLSITHKPPNTHTEREREREREIFTSFQSAGSSIYPRFYKNPL